MDPLLALREYLISKRPVVADGEFYVFEPYKIHKTAPTAFLNTTTRQPYTIEALYFLYTHIDTPHGKYLIACSQAKVPIVTLVDKKEAISYLKGEIDASASIAPEPPVIDPSLIEKITPIVVEERQAKRLKLDDISELELDEKLQKEKEEIASRLDAPKVKPTAVVGDLVEGMSREQLQLLQQKRFKQKMATIATSIPKTSQKPEPGGFVGADAPLVRRIVERERPLSTRNSILNTNNKKTFVDIINAVTRHIKEEQSKKESAKNQQKQKTAGYDRYNVQTDMGWWKDKLKANDLDDSDFQIDTRGTFAAGLSLAPAANGGGGASSSASKVTPSKRPAETSIPASIPMKSPLKSGGIPIIIVPSAVTALLTMYNVKDFLMKGKIITTAEKKKLGAAKEPRVVVNTNSKDQEVINNAERNKDLPTEYHVIDSTLKLTPKDWGRVCAVFAQGQAWQFKGWHWATPVELFTNVRGFYIKFEDELTPPEVKTWNVKTLTVSKSKRHLDKTAALQFWNALDDFMLRKH